MKRLFCSMALILSLQTSNVIAQDLPKTEGQKLFEADQALSKAHLHSGYSKAIKLDLFNSDNQLMVLDAHILSIELTHLQVVEWNTKHPDHQIADVRDILKLAIDAHNKILAVNKKYDSDLKSILAKSSDEAASENNASDEKPSPCANRPSSETMQACLDRLAAAASPQPKK